VNVTNTLTDSRQGNQEIWATYSFNGPESTELALEILFRSIIAKSCNNQGLEGISTDIRIFLGLVWRHRVLANLTIYKTQMPRSRTSEKKEITDRVALTKRWCFLQQLLLALPFLLLDTKFSFQPALGGLIMVGFPVLLKLREEGRNARDGRSLSVFRRVV
jgi:hypothetical protein